MLLDAQPHGAAHVAPRPERPIAIPGILSVGDLVIITAPWDSFKSTFALELVWSLSSAANFLSYSSFPVLRPLQLLVVQAEISPGAYDRRLQIFPAAGFMSYSNSAFTLSHLDDVAETLDFFQLDGVVFDPIGEMWPERTSEGEPFDENRKTHVSGVIRRLKGLRKTVIMVHHDPKPGQGVRNRAAGSSALLNSPDVRIMLDRSPDGRKLHVSVRNRNQPRPPDFDTIFSQRRLRVLQNKAGDGMMG